MRKNSTLKIVLSGLFIALGMVLPFLTGQIPDIGKMLLPMHIPVLLCGYVCGWQFGLFVGFITPLLRSMVFGMPPLLSAVAMAFELAAYGFTAGILYKVFEKKNIFVYISLIISMICGRIVWGIASYALYGLGLSSSPFTWEVFFAGAVANAVPGIILQIIVIPAVVIALKRGNLIYNEE